MDKRELKQDLVRDRIIDSIQYLVDQWIYTLAILCLLIAGISSYGFWSNKKYAEFKTSSELSGLAQNEYNQGDKLFAVDDLEGVLNDYEETDGGTQAYIYLLYDAYVNNEIEKLESLLNTYSVYSDDPFLKSSVLETKAYLSSNSQDYSSAINLLNKSMKVNSFDVIGVRLNISKARMHIARQEYLEAATLLKSLAESKTATNSQKNTIEELLSYVSHMQ